VIIQTFARHPGKQETQLAATLQVTALIPHSHVNPYRSVEQNYHIIPQREFMERQGEFQSVSG